MSFCLVVHPLVDTAVNVSAFFEEAVREAATARGYDPGSPSALYVAQLLAAHAKPDSLRRDTLSRPITLLYREALEAAGPERFRRLRDLGDDALYLSGFFADHLEKRGAPIQFVQDVGATAYDAAAAMLRRGGGTPSGPDVFDELATHFGELALMLGDVADSLYAMSARDPRSVLDVYERWSRRGSPSLADALLRWGLLPTRGGGGLQ